jgi:hypothetical protein
VPLLKRNGDYGNKMRGCIIGLALLGGCVALFASVQWHEDLGAMRRDASKSLASDCQGLEACAQRALQLQARELVTTEAAFTLTLAQILLNLAGLAAVAFTVFYARKAWLEAQRSTDAALRAFEADNRTWLTIRAVTIKAITFREGNPEVNVEVEIKNVGKQPAFSVTQYIRTYVSTTASVGRDARDEIIGICKRMASSRGWEGDTLLDGERRALTWSMHAERHQAADDRMRELVRPDSVWAKPVISCLYCVVYQCPGSEEWRYSAGGVMIAPRPGAEWPNDGVASRDTIQARPMFGFTKMV